MDPAAAADDDEDEEDDDDDDDEDDDDDDGDDDDGAWKSWYSEDAEVSLSTQTRLLTADCRRSTGLLCSCNNYTITWRQTV